MISSFFNSFIISKMQILFQNRYIFLLGESLLSTSVKLSGRYAKPLSGSLTTDRVYTLTVFKLKLGITFFLVLFL